MTPTSFPPRESWSKKILLNGGAVSVSYDSRKWGEPKTGTVAPVRAFKQGFAAGRGIFMNETS